MSIDSCVTPASVQSASAGCGAIGPGGQAERAGNQDRLHAVGRTEIAHDHSHVDLDRRLRHAQFEGDLLVEQSLAEHLQHAELLRREIADARRDVLRVRRGVARQVPRWRQIPVWQRIRRLPTDPYPSVRGGSRLRPTMRPDHHSLNVCNRVAVMVDGTARRCDHAGRS